MSKICLAFFIAFRVESYFRVVMLRSSASVARATLLARHCAEHNGIKRAAYVSIRDLVLGLDPNDGDIAQFDEDFPQCRLVKGRYVTPWSRETEKTPVKALEWLWNRRQNKLKLTRLRETTLKALLQPQEVSLEKINDLSKVCKNSPAQAKAHVTWIGHATCYFEVEGVKFITDPVFSERCFPVQMFGPRRFFGAGIRAKDLDVDVVLLSHTHYDHLDSASALEIGNKALWLVPLGVRALMERDYSITNCIEMNWWDSHNIPSKLTHNPSLAQAEGIDITFTPAKHWTARGLFDRNTCLWGSFAVKSKQTSVFFGGDTAYCDVFRKIGDKLGPFDLSLLPIGAYKPRYFMKHHHCDPEEAVQIHKDLQSKQSLAIHWGTFPLADEDVIEPALELARSRRVAGVEPSEFFTLRIGESYSFGGDDEVAPVEGDVEVLHAPLVEDYITWRQERARAKAAKARQREEILAKLKKTSQGERKDEQGGPLEG
jgi:N-acyl-phosphatidylethanolamine-hydrolysing phospholipase D